MSKPDLRYFQEADILHLVVSEGPEAGSVEISPNVTAELNESGEPSQRIGYLPKDAPRRTGRYLATLHRPEGKRRLEGRLSELTAGTDNEGT